MIPVAEPIFVGREHEYVLDCLMTRQVSGGSYVTAFEHLFARTVGVEHAIACMNGTVALHLALLAMGLQPGDEVIMPSLTYVATANAVTYCGATPVFCDVEPGLWCASPTDVLRRITTRTKGILAVHLYGCPANMVALQAIAEANGLWLVEDAAEAHGAQHHGKTVGSLGDIGTFSFYGNKVITCGEGGMVTTNNDSHAERMRLFRGQGMDPTRRYWHPVIGYNYRMTNMQAALGLAQLETLGWHQQRRRECVHEYHHWFNSVGIEFQQTRKDSTHANWMFTILVPADKDRDVVMRRMEEQGVETRPAFVPMHKLPMYACTQPYPVTEDVAMRGINLPTHAGMTPERILKVCVSAASAIYDVV